MSGYSGKPVWRKLGLKAEHNAVLINEPDGYQSLLGDEAPEVKWHEQFADADFVHVFADRYAPLEAVLQDARYSINSNGMVWVSWPKKSSCLFSEITEDTIRKIALPMGLVDVKVCSVSDVWSAPKLVIRKELR